MGARSVETSYDFLQIPDHSDTVKDWRGKTNVSGERDAVQNPNASALESRFSEVLKGRRDSNIAFSHLDRHHDIPQASTAESYPSSVVRRELPFQDSSQDYSYRDRSYDETVNVAAPVENVRPSDPRPRPDPVRRTDAPSPARHSDARSTSSQSGSAPSDSAKPDSPPRAANIPQASSTESAAKTAAQQTSDPDLLQSAAGATAKPGGGIKATISNNSGQLTSHPASTLSAKSSVDAASRTPEQVTQIQTAQSKAVSAESTSLSSSASRMNISAEVVPSSSLTSPNTKTPEGAIDSQPAQTPSMKADSEATVLRSSQIIVSRPSAEGTIPVLQALQGKSPSEASVPQSFHPSGISVSEKNIAQSSQANSADVTFQAPNAKIISDIASQTLTTSAPKTPLETYPQARQKDPALSLSSPTSLQDVEGGSSDPAPRFFDRWINGTAANANNASKNTGAAENHDAGKGNTQSGQPAQLPLPPVTTGLQRSPASPGMPLSPLSGTTQSGVITDTASGGAALLGQNNSIQQRSTSFTLPQAHRPPPVPPQIMADQVAINIQRGLSQGQDRITVQLRPQELGRVEIKMNVAHDGKLTAVVSVERAETLDLMRQDSRSLVQALSDAGLDADESGLSFQLQSGTSDENENQSRSQKSRNTSFSNDLDDLIETGFIFEETGNTGLDGRLDVKI